MSNLYATAITSAMGALTGEGEASAYNAQYTATSSRLNAANSKNVGERNIASLNQNKMLIMKNIQQEQQKAEANARVAAAVAGAAGGSVEGSIDDTHVNAAHRAQHVEKSFQSSIEQQMANIYEAQNAMLSVRDPNISTTANMINALGQVDWFAEAKTREAEDNDPRAGAKTRKAKDNDPNG